MKNNNHIDVLVRQIQNSNDINSTAIAELYSELKQLKPASNDEEFNNQSQWPFIHLVISSLKQLTSYYDLFLHELKNDIDIKTIRDKAITYLERHYGRNCIHKVIYNSNDLNSIKETLQRLITDIEDRSIFSSLNTRDNIIYTFFDSEKDDTTDFVGQNEQHYRQAQASENHGSFYFYEQWQKERRVNLFSLAAKHEELRGLVLKYIKTIDECQFTEGTEFDLRYQRSQELLFEAPYRGLFSYSDQFILDFIDSYGTSDRWHLVNTEDLIHEIISQYPNSPYLKYLYSALPYRLSSDNEEAPKFTSSFIEQLKDPNFIDELCLITATEAIKNQIIFQSDACYKTLEDIDNDEDIQSSLVDLLHSLKQSSITDVTNESLYIFHSYTARLAAEITGLEKNIDNIPAIISQMDKLNAKISHYIKCILNQNIDPAFTLFYGYESCRVRQERLREERRATPLFAIHNSHNFRCVTYQESPYLIYSTAENLYISDLTQHKGVSWRNFEESNLYDFDAAKKATSSSIAHVVTYDDEIGVIKGWHLGKIDPVFHLTANLHFEGLQLSDDGNTLLIRLTQEVEDYAEFNPDNLDLITEVENTLVVFDLITFTEKLRFNCLDSTKSIIMSSNGKFAIIVEDPYSYTNEEIIYIDLTTGLRTSLNHPFESALGSDEIALSPDNLHFVYKNSLFNIEKKTIVAQLSIDDFIYQYTYSDNGNYILADCDEDGLITIFRSLDGSFVGYLQGDPEAATDHIYLNEKQGIIYRDESASIYAYDVANMLSLKREALQPIDYHFGVIESNTIGHKVDYLLGNHCCDTLLMQFTAYEFGFYHPKSDSFSRPTPIANKSDISTIGCRFKIETRGFSRIHGVTIKLHHPEINGKTITQWESIIRHNQPFTLIAPFDTEELVFGQYRFEVYSNDSEAFLCAQHSISILKVATYTCTAHAEQYGSKLTNSDFNNQEIVTNNDNAVFGFKLRINSDNPEDIHHLILKIEKEHIPKSSTLRKTKRAKKKYTLTRIITVKSGELINAYFPTNSCELFRGKWLFTLTQQTTQAVIFNGHLSVIEIDDKNTIVEQQDICKESAC